MKKQWSNAELKTLGAENTNDAQTKDWPHYWACTKCGKHAGEPYNATHKPTIPCTNCQNTDYIWTDAPENIISPS